MWSQNVETFRRLVAAVNAGDLKGALGCMDPGVEFIPRRAAVQGSYHGHEGVREYLADTLENFDLYEVNNEEIQDLGDRVVAFDTLRIRGKESGVEVTVPTAIVATFSLPGFWREIKGSRGGWSELILSAAPSREMQKLAAPHRPHLPLVIK